jgi:predicted nucleic acid-binding protein
VSLYYADTSALARAYLSDEEDHPALRELLLESDHPVLTSELATVELMAAMTAAERAKRIPDAAAVMRQIDADVSGDPVALVSLDPATVLPLARRLVDAHPLFAVDAIHLAVALADAPSYARDRPVTLVTCDKRQRVAGRAEGLSVWEP